MITPDIPTCSKPGHGPMTLRPFAGQTYEQLWTGPWHDCLHVDHGQRCRNSATLFTDEAKASAEASKRGWPVTATARTILDAPEPEQPGCHYCNPQVKGVGLCNSCFATIDARVAALLALPAVVAIIDRAERLTESEKKRLNQACLDNFQANRLPQLHLHHRVTKAYGDNWRDLLDADGRIFRRFEPTFGPYNFALHAVNDAVFAAMVGDLLDADEARLFTKPWLDITT